MARKAESIERQKRTERHQSMMKVAPPGWWASIIVVTTALIGCGSRETTPDWSKIAVSVDLTQEIQSAEVLVETRHIDFATDAAGENLLEGWAPDPVISNDGSRLRESLGEKSILQFVVLDPRDLDVTAKIGAADAQCEGQELVLELNGDPVQTLRLDRGVQDHQFILPRSNLVRGNNAIVITAGEKTSGSIQCRRSLWGSLSIEGGEPLQPPIQKDGGLFLPFGTAVRYLVEAPSKGYLTVGGFGTGDHGERLGISLRGLGESRDSLAVKLSAGTGAQNIRLPFASSSWFSLTLSGDSSEDVPGNEDGLFLSDIRLRFRKPPTGETVMHSPPKWKSPTPRRPNVIIYLVDTLRADHLGSYGYHKPISPSIDEFAADAVLFERTMAQTSWTRTAVASIFTGMVPTSHGVINRKDGLVAELETLAEVLKGEGYDTASIVATGHVSPTWGMAQGFETFNLVRENDMGLLYALSNGLNPPIIEWLDRDRSNPFFLYVHTLDPHSPYLPRAEAAEKFASAVSEPALTPEIRSRLAEMAEHVVKVTGRPAPVKLGSQIWMNGLNGGVFSATPAMLEDLNALYDAEIFHNDTYFGELLDHLRNTGLYDNTVIIFVSDHGEEFLDHGSWLHGHTLYGEQVEVPLIIRLPDPSAPRNLRVEGLARQIDLAATIADYVGVRAPRNSQGSSLLPLMFDIGVPKTRRTGYAHVKLDQRFAESFFDGKWKLICTDESWQTCELYDLENDPEELIDLAPRRNTKVTEMKRKMKLYLDGIERFQSFEADPDEEIRAQLEALGYKF